MGSLVIYNCPFADNFLSMCDNVDDSSLKSTQQHDTCVNLVYFLLCTVIPEIIITFTLKWWVIPLIQIIRMKFINYPT